MSVAVNPTNGGMRQLAVHRGKIEDDFIVGVSLTRKSGKSYNSAAQTVQNLRGSLQPRVESTRGFCREQVVHFSQ
jgi:hypothetical protein